MSLLPGFNDEGAGMEFARAMIKAEADEKNKPPEPEWLLLRRRLSRALDVDMVKTELVALRVLTKVIRDGVVTRAELAELRDQPLPEAPAGPCQTTIPPWTR